MHPLFLCNKSNISLGFLRLGDAMFYVTLITNVFERIILASINVFVASCSEKPEKTCVMCFWCWKCLFSASPLIDECESHEIAHQKSAPKLRSSVRHHFLLFFLFQSSFGQHLRARRRRPQRRRRIDDDVGWFTLFAFTLDQLAGISEFWLCDNSSRWHSDNGICLVRALCFF